jgi:HK97 family phage portal protein
MGILTKLVEGRNDGEYTSLENPAGWLLDALGVGRTDAGENVNPRTALKFSGVYSCVNVISQTLAQVPFDVYRTDGKKRVVARDRNEHYLLHSEPIPTMTSYQMRMAVSANALLGGNGYAEIIRDRSARVKAIRPIEWHRVSVYESLDEMSLVYKLQRRNGRVDTIDGANMIHVPCLSMDGVAGLSPIEQHRQGIGLALAAEAAGASLMANGMKPSGYLKADKPLKPQEREEIENKLYSKYGGARNVGRTPVFGSNLEWKQLTMSMGDAQYIELRGFQLADIARIYRVPAVLIGLADKTSTYASAEAFFLSFIKFTIVPWVQAIEQEFNRKLFGNSEELYCKLDLNGLLRGDTAARAAMYKALWAIGGLQSNEARAWEDLDPLEGGDRAFVQSGFTPLDRIDEIVDKQATPAQPKQDPQAGGEDHLDVTRSAHTNWLRDVAARVRKWEKKDERKIIDAIIPVFRSLALELKAEIDPELFCKDAARNPLLDLDGGEALFGEETVNKFIQEHLQ